MNLIYKVTPIKTNWPNKTLTNSLMGKLPIKLKIVMNY